MLTDPELVFKALADPARLRIVEFLRRPEAECCSAADRVCACDIEAALGLAQATISHHMKRLQEAGLVHAEKRGRWMHYRLNRDAFAQIADWLAEFSRDADGLRTKGAPRRTRAEAA
ncbi:MAG: winged helix-turn-helix transcriptional regulator [Acetobacteraceae bacterium]|nr:winged helix-turn-helix transcriptional regulator [Acetobacteraceae bacterium]